MSALLELSLKGKNGNYTAITVAIDDETNEYGQNVSAWKKQTEEEREAKVDRDYVGNGKVFYPKNNLITVATSKKKESELNTGGLDF